MCSYTVVAVYVQGLWVCPFGCQPKGPLFPGGYRIKATSDSGIRRHLFTKHHGRVICERRFPDGGRFREIRKLLAGSYSFYLMDCSIRELDPQTRRKSAPRRHRETAQKARKGQGRSLAPPSSSPSSAPSSRAETDRFSPVRPPSSSAGPSSAVPEVAFVRSVGTEQDAQPCGAPSSSREPSSSAAAGLRTARRRQRRKNLRQRLLEERVAALEAALRPAAPAPLPPSPVVDPPLAVRPTVPQEMEVAVDQPSQSELSPALHEVSCSPPPSFGDEALRPEGESEPPLMEAETSAELPLIEVEILPPPDPDLALPDIEIEVGPAELVVEASAVSAEDGAAEVESPASPEPPSSPPRAASPPPAAAGLSEAEAREARMSWALPPLPSMKMVSHVTRQVLRIAHQYRDVPVGEVTAKVFQLLAIDPTADPYITFTIRLAVSSAFACLTQQRYGVFPRGEQYDREPLAHWLTTDPSMVFHFGRANPCMAPAAIVCEDPLPADEQPGTSASSAPPPAMEVDEDDLLGHSPQGSDLHSSVEAILDSEEEWEVILDTDDEAP